MNIILFMLFIIYASVQICAMDYQKIGSYKIPSLGLGTFTITDEQVLENALNKALELGYRHIDTASGYNNEHIIGKVLKEWISSGKIKRENIFVTTKLMGTQNYANEAKSALSRSLQKLQLDYVDLYLISNPIAMKQVDNKLVTQPSEFVEVWKKLEEEVDAGKIRLIGLSNFNISQIKRVQEVARIQPSNIQVETHLYFQQRELREFAQKHNITVTAYSPLGSPGMNTFLTSEGLKPINLSNILQDQVVGQIAQKHNKTNAQIALRFLVQSNIIAIPKSTNPKRLAENIDIFNFTLDDEDMTNLEKLDKGKAGRVVTFEELGIPNVKQHPEYPF